MTVDLKSILLYDARSIGANLVNYRCCSSVDFALILQNNNAFNGVRPRNIGEPTAKTLFLQARKTFFPVCPAISTQLVWAPFDQNTFETNWHFGPITIDTDWPKFIGNKLSEEDRKCFVEGMQSMLEDMHLSDLDEAVIKNIEACKELSTITLTSLGPNGKKKMVINYAATTTVNEHEIQHPAAKLLVLAAKAQQEQIRDGANLTISFAGELLQNAEELIRMGFNPSEITSGYTKAINKAVEILEQLVESGSETMDVRNKDEVIFRMRAAVASLQFGQEEIICSLVADACIQVCPKDPTNFNVDNVRVAKLLGGDLQNSFIVPGMVLESDVVGSIKRMEKAKVAVFADGVDTTATETKGTEQVTTIARNEEGGNSISTVVLYGSTDSNWDDLERAVYNGVNTYKAMCRDSRIVPGAAATEIELAQRLKDYANAETGLDKYAISKYAESFEFVPKTLADNAGLNVMGIIAALYAGHRSGNTKLGIDLVEGACKDVSETKVWDLFATKLSALKYASDAACTVLRVDQIIISKPAGGPRRDAGAGAEED